MAKKNALKTMIENILSGGIDNRQQLRGGLQLRYALPDASDKDHRLLAHRRGIRPSGTELGILRRYLEETLGHAVGPTTAFEHNGSYCAVFRWSTQPVAKQESIMF